MNPIDWTGILAIVFSGLIVLVPVAGITARFALKPIIQSLRDMKTLAAPESTAGLERRLEALEAQLANLDESVERLVQAQEFDRQLGRGQGS
jgi:TolA-binding protein